MDIKGWQGLTFAHEREIGGHSLKQPLQLRPAFDDDVTLAAGHQWYVANELDGITEALFGIEQKGASGQRAAVPRRLGEVSWGRKILRFPSPLVLLPPCGETPLHQQGQAKIQVGIGMVWLESDGPTIRGHGLV